MNHRLIGFVILLSAPAIFTQEREKKPFEQQLPSTIVYKNEDHSETVEIKNVVYVLAGSSIPGVQKMSAWYCARRRVLSRSWMKSEWTQPRQSTLGR